MEPHEIITPKNIALINVEVPILIDLDKLLYGPPVQIDVVIETHRHVGDIVILWGLIKYPKTMKETRCIRFEGSEKFCQKMLTRLRTDLQKLGLEYSEA